jgi:hypothetical protein
MKTVMLSTARRIANPAERGDQASGMLWMRKLESKDAEIVIKKFAAHLFITDEYCDFYFANPYSPWERVSNENLNGLVRQYLPKKSDFNNLTDEQIREIETKINNRPRKMFGFENPIFVMEKLLFNPKVAFVT